MINVFIWFIDIMVLLNQAGLMYTNYVLIFSHEKKKKFFLDLCKCLRKPKFVAIKKFVFTFIMVRYKLVLNCYTRSSAKKLQLFLVT